MYQKVKIEFNKIFTSKEFRKSFILLTFTRDSGSIHKQIQYFDILC